MNFIPFYKTLFWLYESLKMLEKRQNTEGAYFFKIGINIVTVVPVALP